MGQNFISFDSTNFNYYSPPGLSTDKLYIMLNNELMNEIYIRKFQLQPNQTGSIKIHVEIEKLN
jgi:hypothetical protein